MDDIGYFNLINRALLLLLLLATKKLDLANLYQQTWNIDRAYINTHLSEKIADYSNLPYGSVSCTDSSIKADLCSLVRGRTSGSVAIGDCSGSGGDELEDYSIPFNDHADDSNLSLDLSQEIDSAMKQFVSSMDVTPVVVNPENFSRVKLLDNELKVDEGMYAIAIDSVYSEWLRHSESSCCQWSLNTLLLY